MAFGSFDSGVSHPMVDINTTPLVDVMLVLLIIFIVTAPLMTQAVKVDLPQASAETTETKPETVRLAFDAQGTLYWNDEPISGLEAMAMRLQAAVRANRDLEVQISADRDTRYQHVAEIMAEVKKAGVVKLGFVMLPGE